MEALFIVFRDNVNTKLNGITEIDRRNIKGIVKKITAFDCFSTAMFILALLLCLLKLYETLKLSIVEELTVCGHVFFVSGYPIPLSLLSLCCLLIQNLIFIEK